MEFRMKNGSKRKAWTSVQVRELKTLARKKTPAGRKAEEDRGSNAPKSIQSRIIARQPGVTGFPKCFE
jgi:hypothetical protein